MVVPLVEWINVTGTVLVNRDEDEGEENELVGYVVGVQVRQTWEKKMANKAPSSQQEVVPLMWHA